MEMRQGGREQASFSCSPGSHAHLSGVLVVMAMLKGREAVSLADCQHVSLAWNSCTCLWPEFWVPPSTSPGSHAETHLPGPKRLEP